MKYTRFIFVLCLFIGFNGNQSKAQTTVPGNKWPRVQNSKKQYLFPWAGGMNSCQFLPIDMNNDGKKDILVFDRCGNRKMTFINNGSAGIINYLYDPFYEPFFPDFSDWVIFQDYDQDGKEDIFTYSPGFAGIKVYHNISSTVPEFELVVYPYLTSFQGGGNVNILVTYADYPGITDIDGDGDTDILTFWGLGSYVQLHLNQSMEKYGIPDSLDFIRTENCWGRFAEGLESNVIFLDTCNFSDDKGMDYFQHSKDGEKHTGSTFFVYDPDYDGDKDIAIGDADFPYLIRLENGGSPSEALMIGYDTLFPASRPVNLFSMPACFALDINNDGNDDLLISPFDPSPFVSQNLKSNHLYIDQGSATIQDFQFVKDAFLQEDMLDFGSGACPVFHDLNRDGLMDILVSNYGTWDSSWYPGGILTSSYTSGIAFLRNTGTTLNPVFNLENDDFAGLYELGLKAVYPAFGDIDSDGDADMICGNSDGKLLYFENLGGPPGILPVYDDPVYAFQNIDVGEFSTPQLLDLDRDNRIDLIIGEKSGTINYYRNTGSPFSPQFSFITDSLGKVNVRDPDISYYGYSTPCFFERESGKYELVVGSEQGKVFYFKNIDENLNAAFQESDSLWVVIDEQEFAVEKSYRTAPAIGDLNGDGSLELVYGNFSGGLKYYTKNSSPQVQGLNTLIHEKIKLFPNPVKRGKTVIIAPESVEFPVHIDITDISGRLLFSREFTEGEIRINTLLLNAGVYFCSLRSGNYDSGIFSVCRLVVME